MADKTHARHPNGDLQQLRQELDEIRHSQASLRTQLKAWRYLFTGVVAAAAVIGFGGTGNAAGGGAAPSLVSRVTHLEALLSPITRQGDTLLISGVNLQIVNGTPTSNPNSGLKTETSNGVGNLILGYNEPRPEDSDPTTIHSGSHNLVIGAYNHYTNYCGLLSGFRNTATGPYCTTTGASNTASGGASCVVGGGGNAALADFSTVSGGWSNTADGTYSSVSGGVTNGAHGVFSSVSGGEQNSAQAVKAWVAGGFGSLASGDRASVVGGAGNTADGSYSVVTGGEYNAAHGSRSVSGGGYQKTTNNTHGWIAGSFSEQ